MSLDRIVAVKLLLAGALSSPEYVKRFRVEASAAASLQHPNIVTIHEVGVHQGQHYLVMDYVDGPSLAKMVAQQPLPAKRAAAYVKTMAEAVHFAHEHGILHRDLKPSNVLIDANDRPRVTDFGLAKRFEGESEVTLSGQVVGSPSYMPPEQAAAKRGKVSRRSDVYGLGTMLYHLLTGRAPFQAATLTDTLDQVLNTEPVALRLVNPAVPRDLETVCLKCLEKEPAKRYPTALTLAEELGRYLNGQPVLARPIGTTGKVWRWCQRQPVRAGLVAALLFVFALGLTGVLWQWRRAESQRASAEAQALLARRNAYAGDMKEVQRVLEETDLGRARELLDLHRPRRQSPIQTDVRGWEWRYLWARCRSDERFTLHQYSNAVSALAFSPDGKWLAVRREGGAVALWDAAAQRLLDELPANAAHGWRWCNKAMAFSPRENLLAWGNVDARGEAVVSLRHVSGKIDLAPLPHSFDLVSLAFSPDARVIATLDCDGIVRVWDVASQQVVASFPTRRVDFWAEPAVAAPEATATLAPDGTVGPWHTNASPVQPRFTTTSGFTEHYGCVIFSPVGRLLAVGEANPRIRLLDWATGKEKMPISAPAPADGITALAFSPDGRLLAAGYGAADKDVHVWDLETTNEVRLSGHRGWIASLAFSPDGQTLASAGMDQTICLWDVKRRTPPRQLHGDRDEIWAIAWSPDGHHLVTGAKDGSVRYWDPAAKPPAAYSVLPTNIWSWSLSFLPDSKAFLTVTRPEGAVVQWDAANLQKVSLPFLGTNHSSLDLSRDGRWLALGDTKGNLRVWDFSAHRLATNLVFPEALIFAVVFSPRGGLVGCGAYAPDGRIVTKLWEVPTWREISLQGISLQHLQEVDFSPNEGTVALGYEDGTAAWWDLVTRKRLEFFDCHYASPVRVRFSPDGRRFATAGMNGLLALWDVATRQAAPIGRSYRSGLHDLVFSPDGRRLITTGTSPKDLVKFWDVETGRDLVTLPGEPGLFCHHIGFSPDGNTLFADSMEGIAMLWHAPSWEEIEAIEKKQSAP